MNVVDMSALPHEIATNLDQLPSDLRRMLKVQWKEFIHFVEDYEMDQNVRQLWGDTAFPRSNAA